jgi:hypothetical protein
MKKLIGITSALLLAAALAGCASMSAGSSAGGGAPASTGKGWVTILDGSKPKTLEAWDRPVEDNWRFEGGTIMADHRTIPMNGPRDSNFLITKKSYRNYQLHVEVWIDYPANSGIYLRVGDANKIIGSGGYEVNIWDSRPDQSYGTGAIVGVAKVDPMPKAAGKWTSFDITADGPHLVVYMDGNKTADAMDTRFTEGPIALQYGGGITKFRIVKIKEL